MENSIMTAHSGWMAVCQTITNPIWIHRDIKD